MKLKIVVMMLCAMFISSVAMGRAKNDGFALKIGYYMNGDEDSRAGQYSLEYDESIAYSGEYYAMTRADTAVTVAFMYTEPDINGTVNTIVGWQPVTADAKIWQLSASYLKFTGDTSVGMERYEGGFWGGGLGYTDATISALTVGGITFDPEDSDDKSFDLNLIGGYKWSGGLGVEGKWIIDEEAATLMAGWWF